MPKHIVPDNPKPIEVSTKARMAVELATAEVGSIFKYTGETTETYENGALYEIQKASAGDSRRWAKLQSDEWIISFTVQADSDTVLTFQAKDGMTWAQFIISDYNQGTFQTTAGGDIIWADTDISVNAKPEDIIIADYAYTSNLPSLTAPTIELSETTLNIYDEEGLATSYDILVDGEVKATVSKVSLISFTIDGTSYQAEEGMTWGEWVESEYNTDGYLDQNGFIGKNATYLVCLENGGAVTTLSLIEANYNYINSSAGLP